MLHLASDRVIAISGKTGLEPRVAELMGRGKKQRGRQWHGGLSSQGNGLRSHSAVLLCRCNLGGNVPLAVIWGVTCVWVGVVCIPGTAMAQAEVVMS